MAQLLSPGVYIEEQDASAITPSTSANVAFIAGSYTNGPMDAPFVVTNKQEYQDTFGTPTNKNYNEWFQGYKFFDYGNQLIVTRGFLERPETLADGVADSQEAVFTYSTRRVAVIPPSPDLSDANLIKEFTSIALDAAPEPDPANPTNTFIEIILPADPGAALVSPNEYFLTKEHIVTVTSAAAVDNGDGTFSIFATTLYDFSAYILTINLLDVEDRQVYPLTNSTTDTSTMAEFILNEIPNNEVGVGDWLRLTDGIDPLNGDVGQVISFSQERVEVTIDGTSTGVIQYHLFVQLNTLYSNVFTTDSSGKLYYVAQGHFNSGSQALQRGDLNTIDGFVVPLEPNAASSDNIDTEVSVSGLPTLNPNRLNYSYDLVKNDEDFTHLYDTNVLQTFNSGMKLKFLSKTATDADIEISIANYYDFLTDQGGVDANQNFAVAFSDYDINGNLQNQVYLRSLFEYEPQVDEIAIAIRKEGKIETFVVSLNPLSVDGNNKNNYIETVINNQSKFIYVLDNEAITTPPASYLVQDRFGREVENSSYYYLGTQTSIITLLGGKTPMLDEGAYQEAYETILDKEKFEVDVIIGNEQFVNIAIEVADKRKDCIAYVGSRYEDSVGFKANVAVEKIRSWKKGNSGVKPTTTMFAALFTNYFRIYDKFNKKYRWINVAGDMAGIRCDVTSANAPWWVSAGEKRGIIRGINKLAFTPAQEQRDNLYKEGMNPIVAFPGTGNLVWGNKTLYPIASSFDRINIRTLFNTLERSMSKAARSQTFEFNDPYTRNAIMSMFNPYLATIKAGRGITDYLVICDETNNTPDVISRNELRVDIYVKPNYAAEMILLTFTNVGTRSFADVVGV